MLLGAALMCAYTLASCALLVALVYWIGPAHLAVCR
jgi:hypothetical protein